ncbi:MAG: cation:dicarboxylase symporter family transporter [Bacteroidetes bacterium]|nr:cation:dicarboxylase symporter family transporter [Bacteroidota bacterium]
MKLALHWKIGLGMALGIAWSFLSIAQGWSEFTLAWIDPFGEIFIRLLKFIAVPLVLFSIISGITDLADTRKLGRLGIKTLSAYLATTVIAVSLGLLLVNLINPGKRVPQEQRVQYRIQYERWAEQAGVPLKDGRSLLTDPAYAEAVAAAGAEPVVPESIRESAANTLRSDQPRPLQPLVDMVPSNVFGALVDSSMLQVIFFAVFFGIALLFLPGEKVRPVKQLVDGINEVFLKMVDVVMQAAPYFVFALMAGILVKMAGSTSELFGIFSSLGWYALTVLGGLAVLVYVVYPLLLRVFVFDIGYRDFFRGIGPAQLLAFSSSSSAATLPVTMDCVRENLGVSPQVSSFVLPIGATVNMDGTSLYQAVGTVFLAQLHWVDLTMAQQLTIVLTATLASIGSAAVPSAGLIMMMVVLISVGLPPEWVAIILTIDRPLDMCRTVVNVTGDTVISAVVAKSEGELNYVHKDRVNNLEL